MRRPLSGPGGDELRRLLIDADLTDVRVRIAGVLVRFPSAREFLAAELAGTPLGGAVEPARVDRLAGELERELVAYTDDDGVVLPMQTWLGTARRG